MTFESKYRQYRFCKKIASLAKELDDLGLYREANKLEQILRKIAVGPFSETEDPTPAPAPAPATSLTQTMQAVNQATPGSALKAVRTPVQPAAQTKAPANQQQQRNTPAQLKANTETLQKMLGISVTGRTDQATTKALTDLGITTKDYHNWPGLFALVQQKLRNGPEQRPEGPQQQTSSTSFDYAGAIQQNKTPAQEQYQTQNKPAAPGARTPAGNV